MTGQIQQPVDFCHGDLLWPVGYLHNFVSGADFPFFNDAEIEAGALVGNEQAGHLRFTHANADPVAGDSGLGYLEHYTANAVTVADADLVVGKTLDGQVLAELTVFEVIPLQLVLPVAVGIELIDHHSAILSAMAAQISLPISVNIEAPHHHPAGNWLFPDGRIDDFSLPLDVAWKTDVDRNHGVHIELPCRQISRR
jgi:hypothetical protein